MSVVMRTLDTQKTVGVASMEVGRRVGVCLTMVRMLEEEPSAEHEGMGVMLSSGQALVLARELVKASELADQGLENC